MRGAPDRGAGLLTLAVGGVLAVLCCAGLPLLGTLAGSLALSALLGGGAALLTALLLIAVVVVRLRRRRRDCHANGRGTINP